MRPVLPRVPRRFPRVLPTLLSVLAFAAVGCGDDTAEGTPEPPSDCSVSVALSGGYQASLSADDSVGCVIPFGPESGVLMVFLPLEGDIGQIRVYIDEVTEGETGTFPADAGILFRDQRQWETATGGCTVQVDEHSFQGEDQLTRKYLMVGSGSCSAAAEAVASAMDEPITFSPFEFRFPSSWAR